MNQVICTIHPAEFTHELLLSVKTQKLSFMKKHQLNLKEKVLDANLNCTYWNGSNSSLTAKSACDTEQMNGKKYAGWNELKLFGRKNC